MILTAEQWASIQTQLCDCPTSAMLVVAGDLPADAGDRAIQRMAEMKIPQGSNKLGVQYHQVVGKGRTAPKSWTDLTGERAELRVTCSVCLGFYVLHDCRRCGAGSVLVATASVEVLPVVAESGTFDAEVYSTTNGYVVIQRSTGPLDVESEHLGKLDPLPVPGRDWVVVLTDIEVAA